MADNSLQVSFENEVSTVYSKQQLLGDDANSLLIGQLIIQNANSKENIASYIADSDLSQRVSDYISNNKELIGRMALQKIKLQKSLKSKGVDLTVSVIFFHNWSWTLVRLLFLVKPTTREEIVAVVNSCIELQIKMGAAGFKGSWPPVFPDDGGLLFNTKDLLLSDGSTMILNKETMEVTISPGVIERDLQKFFDENDVCLESDVIINSVTYGGVVSSGSHGTGKTQQSVSDYLTELKIVNGQGQIVTYSPQMQCQGDISAADIFAAAQVSLGLFGIAVEYTFKVVPLKYVLVDVMTKKVSDIFSTAEKIQTLWEENWSLEITFFPFQNLDSQGQTPVPYYDAPATVRAINDPISSLPDTGVDTLQFGKNVSAEIVKRLGLNEKGNRTVTFQRLPNAIHFFNTMQLFPIFAMEFCFPYSSDRAKKAMDAVLNVTKSKQSVLYKSAFPLSLYIDARFIQHSDTLLCPAIVGQETTYSFYIQVLPARLFYSIDTIQDYYSAIAEEWFELGGIPHWHKEWTYLPNVNNHIREVYGWRLVKFEYIRKTLGIDPHNLFRNETMAKLFENV